MRNTLIWVSVALCLINQSLATDAPSSTIRLRVHVEDLQAKAVAKARGVLFKATPQTGKRAQADTSFAITKQGGELVADQHGLLETPPLPVKQAYVLEVDAEGYAPEQTRWTHPAQSGAIDLPPVKLRRLCDVKGMVVDRQGRPIANVTAIQSGEAPKRLEAVTDKQGRFVLHGVPEGKAVICFDAAGYRFFGAVLASPVENARIELERADDPNPRTLKREPVSQLEWPEQKRLAVGKELLAPLVAAALAKKTIDETDFSLVVTAARLEPKRVLARINDWKFAYPFRRDQIRNIATNALADHDKPEASLEAASKLATPVSQINAYLYSFQNDRRNRANLPARRLALKKARDLIAAYKETNARGYWLSELGGQLWDIGDHAAAREVFNECRTIFDKLPADAPGRDGLRMTLAIAVARDSVEEARKLAGDLEPGPTLRLAGEIARHHPQEVEAFLANVPSQLSLMQLSAVGNNLPQVCYRVARRDPAAAERILVEFARPPQAQSDADSIFGLAGGMFGNLSKDLIDFEVLKVKAVCYGLIAEAAAKHHPSAARHALLQAVEIIRPLRAGFVHPTNQFFHTPAGLMTLLIPVAERVDRALANEIYWRALSLRIALPHESFDRLMLDIDTPDIACTVKFYDASLAGDLLEPILSRIVSRSYSGMRTYVWPMRSLTLLDQNKAVAFPKLLCERPGWDGSLPRDAVIQFVAGSLTTSGTWDKNLDVRLSTQLSFMRNVYGAYVNPDEDAP